MAQAVAQQSQLAAPKNPDGSPISTDSSGLSAGLLNGQQLAGFRPRPWQDFGNTPQVAASGYTAGGYNPYGYNATTIDNTQMPGALSGFEDAVRQGLDPTFKQQQMGLDDNLASRGIVSTGAATQLNDNLAGQQAAAVAQGESPLIQGFAQNYNSNKQLNAELGTQASQYGAESANRAAEFGAGAGNEAAKFNAQGANEAALTNANYYDQTTGYNANSYNDYLGNLQGYGQQYSGGLMSGFLGTYGGPNNQAMSTLGQGASNAGSAYSDAYNNSLARGSGFGNAFSGIANGFATAASTPGAPTGGGEQGLMDAGAYGVNPDGTSAG